jgi:VWFA-related protein
MIIPAVLLTIWGMFILPSFVLDYFQPTTQSKQIFKVSTELVLLNIHVLDRQTNRPINDLTAEDFLLYEDDVLQTVTNFSRDKQPLSIALLFRATESSRPMLKQLGSGVPATLQHLKPTDEVALIAFSRSIGIVEHLTDDRSKIQDAIIRAGETVKAVTEIASLVEGINGAIRYLRSASTKDNRRIVIVLSNLPLDKEPRRLHTEKEIFSAMDGSETVVCGVISQPLFGARPGVYAFAQQSGGQVISSSDRTINAKLAQLFDELRMGDYTLGYVSSNPRQPGHYRTIQVKLRSRNGKVMAAKKGYYVY